MTGTAVRPMGPAEWLLLVTLSVLWGGTFFAAKIALAQVPPFTLVLARMAIAAAALHLILRVRGLAFPHDGRTLTAFAVMAILNNAIPFSLIFWGQTRIPSGLASILNATTPLWTLGIGLVARTERQLTPLRVVGLLVGFAGALVILAPWKAPSPGAIGGALACLGAAASYGLSYVYMGRQLAGRGLSPLVLSAAQLTAATGLLLLVTPVAGLQPIQLTPTVLVAISILGALGTGAASVLNYRLIADEGPTATSTVTYLLPVVAVVLGIVFLSEPAAAHLLIGTGIVLVGIALVQRRTPAPESTPEASTREREP